MKEQLASLFGPLLALLLLGSCAERPLFRERLELLLPALPAAWAGLEGLEFRLSYRGAEGRMLELRAPPGARLSVEVERGRPQAILARPLWGKAELKPAGALYPREAGISGGASWIHEAAWSWTSLLAGENLALDWWGGWLAAVQLSIEAAGRDPASYDLGRLGAEAMARLTEPWSQEPRRLAAELISGAFRADRLREPPRFPIRLPEPGPWAPESALTPPLTGGQAASIAELSPGLHRFYAKEGGLAALVFEDGSSALIALP